MRWTVIVTLASVISTKAALSSQNVRVRTASGRARLEVEGAVL